MQKPNATRSGLFVMLGIAVLVFLYTATSTRQPAQVQATKRETHRARTTGSERPAAPRAAAPADADFGRYQVIVTRNIFSPPAPPVPKETLSVPPIRPSLPTWGPLPAPPPPQPPQPPAPVGPPPLTGWAYVGYITIGSKQLGILQNDSANTTENVEVGGPFHGYTVQSVNNQQIVLTGTAGARQVLKRPDTYQLVPLGGSLPDANQPRRPGT